MIIVVESGDTSCTRPTMFNSLPKSKQLWKLDFVMISFIAWVV